MIHLIIPSCLIHRILSMNADVSGKFGNSVYDGRAKDDKIKIVEDKPCSKTVHPMEHASSPA